MTATAHSSSDRGRRWTGTYPPLLTIGAVLFLILVVLPSSLNLPQAATQTTPEFAPVPPSDDDPPPTDQGNLSSLSLGQDGAFSGGTGEGEGEGGPGSGMGGALPVGAGKAPTNKRCVGRPPRQTEDPQSPPCVAFFDGDNFGATYAGVTAEEIRILVYVDGGLTYSSSTTDTTPKDLLVDLDEPPREGANGFERNLRRFARYFNDRYQTYGRRAHFFLYFSAGSPMTPDVRRSEAVAMHDRVGPFAALAYPYYGLQDEFVESLAKRGVLNFGGILQRNAGFFQKHAGRIWGYQPSIDEQAQHFADYVCAQVVDRPVSIGGNDSDPDSRLHNGRPRRLGLLRATDPRKPEYTRFADLVRARVEGCGGTFVLTRTYNHAGFFTPAPRQGTFASENMAAFKEAGVSTIIWPQGYENDQSKAAARIGYRPEWILAGDGLHESNRNGTGQDQSVWDRHAYVVTTLTRGTTLVASPCGQAMKEADPTIQSGDMAFNCEFIPMYEDFRQLFTGIQVAGPRLGPTSVDRGFHAIPRQRSTTPEVPACFYEPNDYTCVKDAAVMWWDASGTAPGASNPGCWRMIEDGIRYLKGGWPSEDVATRRKDTDVCNTNSRIAQFSGASD